MVKSAGRVMKILKTISSAKDGLKHSEIAHALNIPKGSLSFLLADLIAEEFVHFDKQEGRYKIGPQVMVLAGRYIAGLDMIKLSQPIIRELISVTNESAGLAVPMGLNVVVVWKEGANQHIKLEYEIGEILPMYASSAGKAILSYYTDEEIEEYISTTQLNPITSTTITDPEKLRHELKKIRSEGIAFSLEEMFEGRIGIAAPVFQKDGNVIATVTQPIPSMRFNPVKENIIRQELIKASKKLSNKLGFF